MELEDCTFMWTVSWLMQLKKWYLCWHWAKSPVRADSLFGDAQELRLVQKTDKQGKNVMWCFVEFEEVVQAARCMKVLQVSHIEKHVPY